MYPEVGGPLDTDAVGSSEVDQVGRENQGLCEVDEPESGIGDGHRSQEQVDPALRQRAQKPARVPEPVDHLAPAGSEVHDSLKLPEDVLEQLHYSAVYQIFRLMKVITRDKTTFFKDR